ncbi:MAG: hypothetical protein GYA23_04275 [Methanomicrobiales archaeon]|nr:hypothetical protein [Methanomicrobiales archaeon]
MKLTIPFFLTLLLIICTWGSGCFSPYQIPSDIRPPFTDNAPANPLLAETGIPSVLARDWQQAEMAVYHFAKSDPGSLSLKTVEYIRGGHILTFSGDDGVFVVNATSGRVQFARFNNSKPSANRVISRQESRHLAESFAREKFPQLWEGSPGHSLNLTLEETQNHGSMGTDTQYIWRDRWYSPGADATRNDTITGARMVRVTVDKWGKILMYSEEFQPDTLLVNLTPVLTEEQAWRIAESEYEKHGVTGILPSEKLSSGLWVYDDSANDIGWPQNGKQYLAWVFSVRHQGTWLMGGQIFIDAHDGHVINYGEIL